MREGIAADAAGYRVAEGGPVTAPLPCSDENYCYLRAKLQATQRLRPVNFCGQDFWRARYAASASSSASLISVLRKNGITETPRRTNCFTIAGVRSVRSSSTAGFEPLYSAPSAMVPGYCGPGAWHGAHHFS